MPKSQGIKNQAPLDVRVVILGRPESGKTSLFNRYVYDEEWETHSTIAAAYTSKKITLGEAQVNLRITDTMAGEQFAELLLFYLGQAHVFIYMIDRELSEEDDFSDDIQRLRSALQKSPDAEVHVAISKCDIQPERLPEFKEKVERMLAKEFPTKSIEVTLTSKKGTGVKDSFEKAAIKALNAIHAKEQNAKILRKDMSDREQMQTLIDNLDNEINSCLPYPNKPRKRQKRDFLEAVIAEHNKGEKSLAECINTLARSSQHNMQVILAGKCSKRTYTLFQSVIPGFVAPPHQKAVTVISLPSESKKLGY